MVVWGPRESRVCAEGAAVRRTVLQKLGCTESRCTPGPLLCPLGCSVLGILRCHLGKDLGVQLMHVCVSTLPASSCQGPSDVMLFAWMFCSWFIGLVTASASGASFMATARYLG